LSIEHAHVFVSNFLVHDSAKNYKISDEI